MADLVTTLRTTLTGDATLMALLTGSVLDEYITDTDGGGSDAAPREADNVRIKPYAYIRWRDSNETGPTSIGAERQVCEIYVYQQRGYTTIDSAIDRMRTLLHGQYLTCDNRQLAHFWKTFTSRALPAKELGGLSCKFVRFLVTQARI